MSIKTSIIRLAPALAALAPLAGMPFAVASPQEGGRLTIGVPLPQAQLGQGSDAAEALRQTVMIRLRTAAVELVPLTASTPAEVETEASGKGCAQVLYMHVEQKHGMGGLFGKLAPLASALPIGALGGGGSALTGALTQTAMNAASTAATNAATSAAQKQMLGAQQVLAAQQPAFAQVHALADAARSSIKRGDSISLEYRLAQVGGGAPLKSDTLHAKADTDGQDVLTPLVEQLAHGVGLDSQNPGGGAASAGSGAPGAGQEARPSLAQRLFGGRGSDSSAAASTTISNTGSGGTLDCAKIASMPHAVLTEEQCQKTLSLQQSYNQAIADPRASRPGDEQMTCQQIMAELNQQHVAAPDQTKVAELTAASAQEQALLSKHKAEADQMMAAEQVSVAAARAADRATETATYGLVRPNATAAVVQAAQARNQVAGERMAEERKPTEQKLEGGVIDMAGGAAQQFADNPRLARLIQLSQTHGCRGM